jgi:hypothetical protein
MTKTPVFAAAVQNIAFSTGTTAGVAVLSTIATAAPGTDY